MPPSEFTDLLERARRGCSISMGRLLDGCRMYLLAIANAELDPELMAKIGGSDVVQQSLAEGCRAIKDFRGGSLQELQGWLRRILLNNLKDLNRDYRAAGIRDVARERPGTDSQPLDQVPADCPSPSDEVSRQEDERRLEAALALLPEEYRRVIELRNRDRLRFAEIGRRLDRSEDAARMLWKRALAQLRKNLDQG